MRILITVLLLCISAVVFAQVNTSFRGTLNVYQASGTSPNYEIRGIFNDTQGYYTSDSVDVGDVVFMLEGSNCVRLEITNIISTAGGIIRVDVTDSEAVLVNPPLGNAAILEETPNYGFPTFVDGISNDLLSCIQNHFALQVDDIVSGSGGVPGVPGNTQDTVVQVAHGLSLLDPVFINSSGNWLLSNITTEDSIHMAIVTEVISSDTLILTYNGLTEQTSHGYTVGGVYFVQDDGTYATTVPTNFINDIAFYVVSDSTLYITEQRPISPMTDLNGIYSTSDTIPDGTIATADEFTIKGKTNPNWEFKFWPSNDNIYIKTDSVLLTFSNNEAVFRDYKTIPTGIEYNQSGYVTNARSLTTKEYVDSMITTVGIPDGDKGDIVVSSSGTVWNIDSSVIDGTNIVDESIGSNDIGTGQVTNSEILNGTIEAVDIAVNQINSSHIVDYTIQATDLDTGSVNSTTILDGTVTITDLNFVPVTGSTSNTTYIPRWATTTTLTGDSRYVFNNAYPAIEVNGSYASNATLLRLSAGGANPIIQSSNNNNGLIFRVGGNGSYQFQNNSGTTRFEILGTASRSYFSDNLQVGTSATVEARLITRGSGATNATKSFIAENNAGTNYFTVDDAGGIFAPIRTGTATALAGWDVNHKSTDVTKGNDLTLTSGTLNVNRDTFPTFDDLLNIYETDGAFTNIRTATIQEDSLLLFQSTNSESGLPYRHYIGTLLDDIDSGDYIFGRYSLTGDIDNYLMDFEGYSYDEGSIIKRLSAYDGSSSSSLTYSASNFQVIVNTVGGICKIRATDAGTAILEGENGIEFKDGPVTSMMTLNTDAARLESSLILVNDAADLAEDGQIWKEENRLNFNTANLSTALSGVMFTGTTDATVANTTTETTLIPSGEGTVTIPANYIKAGKTFTIEAWGIYTADASPSTLEIKATLGGVLLCTTGANTMTTSEGGQWHTTITFTCRTTGATGTVMSQGETRFNHAVGAGTTYWMRRSATNTINTTASNAIDITATHGAADPDNSITLTNIKITVEN